jgi:hypothetical protein
MKWPFSNANMTNSKGSGVKPTKYIYGKGIGEARLHLRMS